MTINFDFLPALVFGGVIFCWLVFAAVFLLRKRPSSAPVQKRDRASLVGILLQGLGYAAVWTVRRPMFTPIAPAGKPLEMALAFVALAAAVGSVWLVMASVRALGKQWSLAARLVEGHKLVTEGPYRFVRHPIYTGMFGMLLATALAVSHWMAILPAFILFWIGTVIRVRIEERLLREQFGPEWDSYVQKVPAVIPGLY